MNLIQKTICKLFFIKTYKDEAKINHDLALEALKERDVYRFKNYDLRKKAHEYAKNTLDLEMDIRMQLAEEIAPIGEYVAETDGIPLIPRDPNYPAPKPFPVTEESCSFLHTNGPKQDEGENNGTKRK